MNRTLTDVKIRREAVVSKAGGQAVAHCEAVFAVTSQAPEFIDITDEVEAVVGASGARFGQATVFSGHTTAAIRVNENEPLLLQDLARVVQQLAPMDEEYEHNDFSRRENIDDEECANGHAHCQHLFLSTSETVPIIDGRLALGTWQRIFLVELDRPRERKVLVNVVGVRG
jgi:secondary thiamine-phosphate synthase enzyme